MRNLHLTYDGTQWVLSEEGSAGSVKFGDQTKQQAIKVCAENFENKGISLKIHKQDGTFEEKRTYPRSADPKRSPG